MDGSLSTIGYGEGSAPGEMIQPRGLAICMSPPDSIPELYVSDSMNNRIQVFNMKTGDVLRCIGPNFGDSGRHLYGPRGLVLQTHSVKTSADKKKDRPTFDLGEIPSMRNEDLLKNKVLLERKLKSAYDKDLPEKIKKYTMLLSAMDQVLKTADDLFFSSASGRTTDSDGKKHLVRCCLSEPIMYVADYSNNSIEVFNGASGEHLRSIGSGNNIYIYLYYILTEAVIYIASLVAECFYLLTQGFWLICS